VRPAGAGRPLVRAPPGAAGPLRATRASSRPRIGEDCLGIICGLGRGAPGTPPGRGVRPSPSRAAGARAESPGPELPGRCMPWVEENGLLPGRGAPGRGALGVAARAARAAGASGTALGSAGAGTSEGAGIGTTGAVPFVSTAGATFADGGSAGALTSTGAGAGAGAGSAALAAAFLAGLAATAPWARNCSPKFSLSRRTTGGSTVDDADRTNSPMSLSVANTTLLSTPYSLASS
jgi:hypothetical protein